MSSTPMPLRVRVPWTYDPDRDRWQAIDPATGHVVAARAGWLGAPSTVIEYTRPHVTAGDTNYDQAQHARDVANGNAFPPMPAWAALVSGLAVGASVVLLLLAGAGVIG